MKKLLLVLLSFVLLFSCENKADKKITAQMLINKYTGKGVCFLPNVGRYSGEFKDGMRHGQGNFYPAYGDNWVQNQGYRGEWKYDMRHGEGTFYGDELTYEGEWEYDKWNGKGICYFRSGFETAGSGREDEYSGEWKDGKRHGQGKERIKRNSNPRILIYEGEWKDDKRSGKGRFYTSTEGGWSYEGEWKDDKMNGQFKVISERSEGTSGFLRKFKDGKQWDEYEQQWSEPRFYIPPTQSFE
jgi:hypothetical protein